MERIEKAAQIARERRMRETLEDAKNSIERYAIYASEPPFYGGWCESCGARWTDRTKPDEIKHKPTCILSKIDATLRLLKDPDHG